MDSHDAHEHTLYKSPDVSSSFSTKYLLESETGSMSAPGNDLTGHIANNSPTANRVIYKKSGRGILGLHTVNFIFQFYGTLLSLSYHLQSTDPIWF